MTKIKVLITVKTYPSLSQKYDELVCTAGFKEDGSWIRLYPIPFRKLDYEKQFKKWQWVELDVTKNTSDFRPESFRPVDITADIKKVGERIDTKNNWAQRKQIVFHQENSKCWNNMTELIEASKNKENPISLATFKPKEILDFTYEAVDSKWDPKKVKKIEERCKQLDLFEEVEPLLLVNKLPYKFKYRFTSEDGKERNLMIEDWEVGALYWNLINSGKTKKEACEGVRAKYLDFAHNNDLFFFLGTTKRHHYTSKNPFMIIGAFYPKKEKTSQLNLFDDLK